MSQLRIYVNSKKVFDMAPGLHLGHRWQQFLLDSTDTTDDFEGLMSDEMLGLNPASVEGFSVTGLGGTGHATSSYRSHSSISWGPCSSHYFYHLFSS